MRYYIQNIIDLFRYNLPAFFKNLWLFRKALWSYRWYQGAASIFCFTTIALKDMADGKSKRGYEEEVSTNKKVTKMLRAAYIMECFYTDSFIELAEEELGPLDLGNVIWIPNEDDTYTVQTRQLNKRSFVHNRKVFARAREIEESYWKELWIILEGQDYSKFTNKLNWEDQFDGSGLRGWWD